AEGGRRARAPPRAWTRQRRVRSGSRDQPVADSPYRLEVTRLGRLVLDLLPEPAHMHGDGPRVQNRLVPPDARHQLVPREHTPRMAREEPEEIELLRREPELDTCF